MKIKLLKSVGLGIGRKAGVAGKTYDLPEETAKELVQMKVAEYVTAKPPKRADRNEPATGGQTSEPDAGQAPA